MATKEELLQQLNELKAMRAQIANEPSPSPMSFQQEEPGFMDSFLATPGQWGQDAGNALLGVAKLPYTAVMGLSDAVNGTADFISGTNYETGQPVDRPAMLDSAANTIQNLNPANIIPGVGTALKAGTDYLSDVVTGQDKYLKTSGEYGADLRQNVAALPAAGVTYGFAKGAGKVYDYPSGSKAASRAVNELRDISDNPSFLTSTATDDALATNIATNVAAKAKEARLAAGSQFQNLPEGSVDISPVLSPMNEAMTQRAGITAAAPAVQNTVDQLNTLGSPSGQFGAAGPTQPIPLQKFQNVLRDVGAAEAESRGTWGSTVLTETKENLLKQAEAQLPPEVNSALLSARDAWKNYEETFNNGTPRIAQEILNKPDKRLDTLYNKVLQDQKSAYQLMSVLDDAEKTQVQSLVLQKMLEKPPTRWASYLDNNRGALAEIFGDETLNGLSEWASGGSRGSNQLLQPVRRAAGSSVASLPAAGVAGVLLGPKALVAVEAAGTVLGVLKGRSLMGARNLLRQAATGNPQAIATINQGGITNQLTNVIGTTGAGLAMYLGGAEEDTPNPLPRDWNSIKENPQSLSFFSNVLKSIGLIPPEANAEDLPENAAKQAVAQATMIAPMAFQEGAGGYQSVVNGRFQDPFEQEMHMQEALDLEPHERAKVMSGLYDRGKYVPINTTPATPTQIEKPSNDYSIDTIYNNLNGSYEVSPEMDDQLSQLERATATHLEDFP